MSTGERVSRSDAVLRLGPGCDEACVLCEGLAPAPAADAMAVAKAGGARLTVRGARESVAELLAGAGEWQEIRVHTHGLSGPLHERAQAVQVPLFSHVDVVHDRIVDRRGGLAESLASIAAHADAGRLVDVEIPLLPRRLAHPLSILRRVRAVTSTLRSVRFAIPRGPLPRSLLPPPWSVGAAVLEEALRWCEQEKVAVDLTHDDAIPFCALVEYPDSLGRVHRFDPRRRRDPARLCSRVGPCVSCACEPHCPGIADVYARAHAFAHIEPFESRPSALYDQRTTPARVWTDGERRAARSTGLLVLRPTVNCNQDCLFCSANETSANVWTASSSMYQQIARAARRGVERLAFGGGEPTLARALPEYVAAARRLGIDEVELVTNGTLLDDEARVAALEEAGLTHAFVSLHAHTEELSRLLTQKEGDFLSTVVAIELLVAAGIRTSINHVITRRNHRYLSAFVRFVNERFGGEVAISFAFVTPQYKALENFELIPRMSEVRPYMQEALAIAVDLQQPCWVGARQGLPPCQLGAFRAWSDIFEHAEAGLSEDKSQKVQGPACERCAYADVCTGVWRAYADRYGFDELEPIELPRFGGRERVVVDDLKTEPWGVPPFSLSDLPDFLRDVPAEARLALRASPSPPPAIDETFSPRRTRSLRVALVGSSTRARRLARAVQETQGLTLDAVVSPHAPDASTDDFGGCPRWRDIGTALREMRADALVIAADPHVQTQLAILALDAGLPVLLSRPLAPSGEAWSALTRAAAESSGILVPAYGLLHAECIANPHRLALRVGPGAPLTWSRRTLAPHLEELFALALKGDPTLSLTGARAMGRQRPERVQLELVGEHSLELLLDFGPGEPRLLSGRDGETRTASPENTEAMMRHFAAVAAGQPDVSIDTERLARAVECTAEALDRLQESGVVFERPGEPRHVASKAFQRGRK